MKYKVNSIFSARLESYLDVDYWFEVRLDRSDDPLDDYDYEPEYKGTWEYEAEMLMQEDCDDDFLGDLFDDLDPDDLVDIDFDEDDF